MVEHSAVNRRVVGSSPTRGAKDLVKSTRFFILGKNDVLRLRIILKKI